MWGLGRSLPIHCRDGRRGIAMRSDMFILGITDIHLTPAPVLSVPSLPLPSHCNEGHCRWMAAERSGAESVTSLPLPV